MPREWVRHCVFDSFTLRFVFVVYLRAPIETIVSMEQDQQQPQRGELDINAADNDFLPVLTSETTQEPAGQDLNTTTRQGGDGHAHPQDSIRVGEADADTDKISAGFSAGSLAQTIGLPAPRLVREFRMQARLEGKVALGRSCWGERNWIGICGGEWSATWGRGTVVVSLYLLFVSGVVDLKWSAFGSLPRLLSYEASWCLTSTTRVRPPLMETPLADDCLPAHSPAARTPSS